MPKTLRRALYRKLRELPEMGEFRRDFTLMTGMSLAFVDDLGLGDDLNHGISPLCRGLQESAEGRALCARARHALFASALDKPCGMTCDAGLCESVVPLDIGAVRAGYFVFGGVRSGPVGPPSVSRASHLLRKNGISMEDGRLEDLLRGTPEVPVPTQEACRRMVLLFARQIALKLTDQLTEPEASMPPAVTKALRFIRTHALVDDIDLAATARFCGVSQGHLSRLFHHTTGLTFREFLAQVRVENARDQLLRSNRNVAEIAYDSGFQSLSQFHRVFQKAFGTTPGKLRAGRGAK